MALGMGRETAGEIIGGVALCCEQPRHRALESSLNLDKPIAAAPDIGGECRRPQSGRGEIELLPCRREARADREAQALAAVVETLRRRTEQVLRVRQTARQTGEVKP